MRKGSDDGASDRQRMELLCRFVDYTMKNRENLSLVELTLLCTTVGCHAQEHDTPLDIVQQIMQNIVRPHHLTAFGAQAFQVLLDKIEDDSDGPPPLVAAEDAMRRIALAARIESSSISADAAEALLDVACLASRDLAKTVDPRRPLQHVAFFIRNDPGCTTRILRVMQKILE